MKGVVGFALYVLLSVLNAGFVNADLRAAGWSSTMTERGARGHCAFAIGWSLAGVSWIVTPFVTGFYYNGWSLNCYAAKGEYE